MPLESSVMLTVDRKSRNLCFWPSIVKPEEHCTHVRARRIADEETRADDLLLPRVRARTHPRRRHRRRLRVLRLDVSDHHGSSLRLIAQRDVYYRPTSPAAARLTRA